MQIKWKVGRKFREEVKNIEELVCSGIIICYDSLEEYERWDKREVLGRDKEVHSIMELMMW